MTPAALVANLLRGAASVIEAGEAEVKSHG